MSETIVPVFVLKAKDVLALATVEFYRDKCLELGLTEQATEVELALTELREWRTAHLDQLKVPNHRHKGLAQHYEL